MTSPIGPGDLQTATALWRQAEDQLELSRSTHDPFKAAEHAKEATRLHALRREMIDTQQTTVEDSK